MSEDWEYQLRFRLTPERADLFQGAAAETRPIADVLVRHKAQATSQYDAFANYCAEAEKHGIDQFPLYKWTKAVIEDPVKKAKHQTAFAIYLDGAEVYDKASADALEADLRPLLESGLLAGLSKHDTNPENNPQAPAHLR